MKLTREQWFFKMKEKLRADFQRVKFPLPSRIRMGAGWPLGGALIDSKGSRTLGQCCPASWSKSKHWEIFINPCVGKSDVAAEVLVHELIHAAVGTECGHKGNFKRAAIEIGLVGPMRSTKAGPKLKERLNDLVRKIGKYPHATLDTTKRRKQGTRMLKLQCESCGYVVRTTQSWIEKRLPICPCSGLEFTIAE